MDSSWNRPGQTPLARSADQERRTTERQAASEQRAQERDAARNARFEQRAAAAEERRAATPRRRASGAIARTGEAIVARDTRAYRTVVDTRRIRELARRGASTAGLAAAFGITIAEVEAALTETSD